MDSQNNSACEHEFTIVDKHNFYREFAIMTIDFLDKPSQKFIDLKYSPVVYVEYCNKCKANKMIIQPRV